MHKKTLTSIFIIFLIFAIGLTLRLESATLPGLNETEKMSVTDENGLPYMYELDSYYHYRLIQNFLKNGHLGDTIKYNQSWDSYSYFPEGKSTKYPPLIVWVAIIFYWTANFITGISLLESCFWLPAFIGPLSGIVGYLLVRKYAGESAGLVTGILLVTAPFYLIRTVPGFFDTDMFNILLPLLIVWFLLESIDSSKKSHIYLNTFLASLFLVLFALAWTGWSYLLYILIFAGLIYGVLGIIKGIPIKNFLKIFLSFLSISLILIYFISALGDILSAINYLLSFLIQINPLNHSSWPNIYESVSELNKPSLEEFVYGAGAVNLGLGILGILFICSIMVKPTMRKKYLPELGYFFFILLFIWLVVGLIAFSSSLRFALIIIPPLAICSGFLVAIFGKYLHKSSLNTINKKIAPTLTIIFVLMVCLLPILNVFEIYYHIVPKIDDDMMDASLWIQNYSSKNTVIVSDWRDGHFLSEFTDRPVLWDGGSQNTPRAYWIYKAFSTDNETLSKDILSMITSNGDASYTILENYTKNTTLTVKIMNNILGVSKDKARVILIKNYKINPVIAEKILNNTHSQNKEYTLFIPNMMIFYLEDIFKFGDWDFAKNNGKTHIFSSGTTTDEGNLKRFNNGIVLDLNQHKVTWNGKLPSHIFDINNIQNGSFKSIYLDNSSDFFVILLSNYNSAYVIDKKFEKSMLIKLLVQKKSDNSFKIIYKNKSVTVWKSNN